MTEWQRVADLISSLGTTGFSQQFAAFLKTELYCDQVLLLGCRSGKHPIYLYDCIDTKREFLFQHYLMESYLQDPFICMLSKQLTMGYGVCRICLIRLRPVKITKRSLSKKPVCMMSSA